MMARSLWILLVFVSFLWSKFDCKSPNIEIQQSVRISTPIIIAHRGASGYRPEHTLAAYELAFDLGADFIEADLVSTRDHVLVARHANELSSTTNVADLAEFADRKKTKFISGMNITGWFTEDFYLHELKTIRAKQAWSFRNQKRNSLYSIPTLQEVIQLVQAKEEEFKKPLGIYLETKSSSYFASIGLPLEDTLIDVLEQYGYLDNNMQDRIFIESFESTSLRYLKERINVPLIQLIHNDSVLQMDTGIPYREMTTEEGLHNVSLYAAGIGPRKNLLFSNANRQPTNLIQKAKKYNLLIHTWTFRSEKVFLEGVFNTGIEEMSSYFQIGVDGIFTEQPDEALQALSSVRSTSQGVVNNNDCTHLDETFLIPVVMLPILIVIVPVVFFIL